jgi:hypothetical protein
MPREGRADLDDLRTVIHVGDAVLRRAESAGRNGVSVSTACGFVTLRARELCAGLRWKFRRVLAGSCRPRCPAGWAELSLSGSNRRTAASVACGTARLILTGRPSLCRWRIWVIAARCVASFAATRARAAPAGGLAVAGGDPRPVGCCRRRRSGLR